MSKISFVTFCVENYAARVGQPSNEVYQEFKNQKLLDLLYQDYNDLHGMSTEYMVQFCQEYLKGK